MPYAAFECNILQLHRQNTLTAHVSIYWYVYEFDESRSCSPLPSSGGTAEGIRRARCLEMDEPAAEMLRSSRKSYLEPPPGGRLASSADSYGRGDKGEGSSASPAGSSIPPGMNRCARRGVRRKVCTRYGILEGSAAGGSIPSGMDTRVYAERGLQESTFVLLEG